MKSHTKVFCLLHWICDNQRPKPHENTVNPLYLIINKISGFMKERNGNEY